MENGYRYDFVDLDPTQQVGLHFQDTWELSAVFTGAGERLIGEVREKFEAGDVVLVPPGITHCWYFNPVVTNASGHIVNASLMITKEMLRRLVETFPALKRNYDALLSQTQACKFDGEMSKRIIGIMQDLRQLDDIDRIPRIISLLSLLGENLCCSICISGKQEDNTKRKLKQIEIYVACNYARHIGIDDLARHLGMNKSAFCAFFKRHMGRTFVTYLNEYRLSQAEYLIRTKPEESISQIAYACGFQTISHFNHLFRAAFGTSPLSMRKKLESPSPDSLI